MSGIEVFAPSGEVSSPAREILVLLQHFLYSGLENWVLEIAKFKLLNSAYLGCNQKGNASRSPPFPVEERRSRRRGCGGKEGNSREARVAFPLSPLEGGTMIDLFSGMGFSAPPWRWRVPPAHGVTMGAIPSLPLWVPQWLLVEPSHTAAPALWSGLPRSSAPFSPSSSSSQAS